MLLPMPSILKEFRCNLLWLLCSYPSLTVVYDQVTNVILCLQQYSVFHISMVTITWTSVVKYFNNCLVIVNILLYLTLAQVTRAVTNDYWTHRHLMVTHSLYTIVCTYMCVYMCCLHCCHWQHVTSLQWCQYYWLCLL